ncbi:MAG: TRAP transporter large permease subunit [Treponema sp.]|jgi:tripartite ATP-independent transporter DctM subunit|nr:TRAP transporter large permease subunit [Treponema sp.]
MSDSGGGRRNPLSGIWPVLEIGVCCLALVLLAVIPIADAVMRIFFKLGFPDAQGLLVHVLLVAGLFTGLVTTKNGEHLSIGLVEYFSGEKTKRIALTAGHIFSSFVVTLIAWASLSFIKIGLMGRLICGIIPDRAFALVIPLAYIIMAFRFASLAPLKGVSRALAFLAPVLATVLSLPIIAKAVWGFELSEFFITYGDMLSFAAWRLKIPGIILLVLAAAGGTPLFTVMGGFALLLIAAAGGESDVAANQVYLALTQENIAPIPLFTLSGFFLSESKAGRRLVACFRGLFGGFPGGMIVATVVICAFFTSFTGASGVTILALGGLLYTILREHLGYPESFTIGLLTSTGSIGLLFPPSLPVILVGATTQTHILHLFAGGVIPGIILVLSVIILGIAVSAKTLGKNANASSIPAPSFNLKSALAGIKESALEILLPVFLVVAFFSGILSITELGAVSLVYVFIVEVLVHRDIPLKDCWLVFKKAIPIIGGVLSIIAFSMALSYYIIDSQVPQNLAAWMVAAVESKYLFLLMLNAFLLIVGCLMDIFSAILVVLPLVSPLGAAYGIDPVHLGIIFIINLEVGFLTPPVGLNLFLASYRFKKPFMEICRHVLPFLLIQFAVVLLVTYIPALSTFLSNLF